MTDYKVSQVKLDTVNYMLRIIQIPQSEMNDKLTYFSRERGLISKFLFEDFLIVVCIPEVHAFVQQLQQLGISKDEFVKIRSEVVSKVLEINPLFKPENLMINQNQVLKLAEGPKNAMDTPLTENPHWGKDPTAQPIPPIEDKKELDKSKLQLKDLSYTKKQQYWRRLGQYVIVKYFDPGSEAVILGNKQFTTRHAFEQYIVAVCIDEVEDLFTRIDKMNLRISPPVLVHELYELCQKANPSLNYDVFKDMISPSEESGAVDPFESLQASMGEGLEKTGTDAQEKGRVKSFRQVKKEKLLSINDDIKKKVVGQDVAIDTLIEAIQRASVGLRDPNQPIGSFIFTGYTGVGKSYTAKVLAEELLGSRNGLVVIDCSEYAAEHEYAKLIGAPSGYIGHEHGGYLTNAIKKHPFSIILFDEIEKASEKVHQLMLQIMDEARLTDGKGVLVSFKDTILVMTSNVGVKEMQTIEKTIGFGNVADLNKTNRDKALKDALKSKFKPEFLNRITDIVHFDPLTKSDYFKVIKLEFEKLKRNLRLNQTEYSKLDLKFDKTLYNFVYKTGIDEKLGARPLIRAIEREISNPLATKLLKENIDCATTKIVMRAKNNKVIIDSECVGIDSGVDAPPFYMRAGLE